MSYNHLIIWKTCTPLSALSWPIDVCTLCEIRENRSKKTNSSFLDNALKKFICILKKLQMNSYCITYLKSVTASSLLGYELSRKTWSKRTDSSRLNDAFINLICILRKLYMNSCCILCLKPMIISSLLRCELSEKREVKWLTLVA